MEKPIISIIIINWNGILNLKKCLKSLEKNSIKKLQVIVVDNGSVDGSVKFIKSNYPQIQVIENKENLGFAEGNNIGYRFARGKFVLFLNNDTQVTEGFLNELLKKIESENNLGGVQSRILLMDDHTKLDSIGAFFTRTGFLYHFGFRKKDTKELEKEIDLYSAKGACMLFKKSVLDKVKVRGDIFDGRYFAYFEETDLCHRVWLAGYRIAYCPQSIIYHKVGATSEKFDNAFVQYHSFKNRINSYVKNLGLISLILILPVHLLFCLAAALSYLFRGKMGICGAIFKAFIWNLGNLAETLEQRGFIQNKIRKISDKEFLPSLTKPVSLNYFIAHLRGLESYEG